MHITLRNIFVNSLLLTSLFLSSNSFATTICSSNCPSTGGSSGGSVLPQILEIFPMDGSDLILDTTGLILLDSNIFNNLANLTINSSTIVYIGESTLPSNLALPDTLELNTLSYTGGLSITGLANAYVLLQQFNATTSLNLTAANGILVMDTSTLAAVPLPGSIIFMFSGLTLLCARSFKKNIAINLNRPKKHAA